MKTQFAGVILHNLTDLSFVNLVNQVTTMADSKPCRTATDSKEAPDNSNNKLPKLKQRRKMLRASTH